MLARGPLDLASSQGRRQEPRVPFFDRQFVSKGIPFGGREPVMRSRGNGEFFGVTTLGAEEGSVVPGATFFFCIVEFGGRRSGGDGVGRDCEGDFGGGCEGTERCGVRCEWWASLVGEENPWDCRTWGCSLLRDYGLN
jgi:hypothetical protein